MKHPIDNIQWVETDLLDANDYNPNVVARDEFRLLKHSLLKQGWMQPILVAALDNGRYRIIDGFHRSTLAKDDPEMVAAFGTKVPCAVMEMTEAEAKMLTVRINRAKGSHVSNRMHDLVSSLHHEDGLTIPQLMSELGASKGEVELLLHENIFKKMEIETYPYSRAWVPPAKGSSKSHAA